MMRMLFLILPTLALALITAACAADAGSRTVDVQAAAATRQAGSLAAGETAVPSVPDPAARPVETPEPAPAQREDMELSALPVIKLAPRWDNEIWINSDSPLTLEELRGKVVLLEFWTFG
jgi:hypothetical protein